MKSNLASWIFDLISHLPLSVLHRFGIMAGWISYWISGNYSQRLRDNLLNAHQHLSFEEVGQLLKANIAESGKGGIELVWMWRRPLDQVVSSVRDCQGWELVEAAHQQGRGLIILTPHIGCFDVIGQYVSSRMTMTCMYRVPKLNWLDKVMRAGRERGQMKLAKADLGGVRVLLKALKRGEVIGVLPDQVPGNGEGEWAPFFGRPAYTMTLVGRLAEASGAVMLLSYAERLPNGDGYIMRFYPLKFVPGTTPLTQQLNAALEEVIRACPAQYLWSYNRYKTPAGVLSPDSAKVQ
jgi:KDO2-lipid IV(A) lauroyltransferase